MLAESQRSLLELHSCRGPCAATFLLPSEPAHPPSAAASLSCPFARYISLGGLEDTLRAFDVFKLDQPVILALGNQNFFPAILVEPRKSKALLVTSSTIVFVRLVRASVFKKKTRKKNSFREKIKQIKAKAQHFFFKKTPFWGFRGGDFSDLKSHVTRSIS
jgi:hypothetical protein